MAGMRRGLTISVGLLLSLFAVTLIVNTFFVKNIGFDGLIFSFAPKRSPLEWLKPLPPRLVNPNRQTTKYVSLWTKFFGDPLWENFFNKQNSTLELDDGSGRKCLFLTADKLRVDEADAVVFHGPDIQFDEIPNSYRTPQQYWTYFALEAPIHLHFEDETKMKPTNAMRFNWTMSYSRKSDVWYPYGRFQKLKADRDIVKARILRFEESFQRRKKDAVWLASNCVTSSHRELLVRKLRSSGITVDIFGKCGSGSFNTSISKFDFSEYRFYLAFENCLCDDYITEKAFQAYDASLRYGVIPVVYGGANFSDLLPPGSFIDLFSFQNVIDLASYLKTLSGKGSATQKGGPYLSSFYEWQFSHQLQDYDRNFTNHHVSLFGWPAMCEKLWSSNPVSSKVHDVRVPFGTCRTLTFKNAALFNFSELEFFVETSYLGALVKDAMMHQSLLAGGPIDRNLVNPIWSEIMIKQQFSQR